MSVPEGVVVRSLSGFFDVADGADVRRCRARGVFRKRGTTVLVGDRVRYEPIGRHEGTVVEVMPRRNQLVRPPVANIDLAILVFSAVEPAFQPYLLDRLLAAVCAAGLVPVVVVTKVDLAPAGAWEKIEAVYAAVGYSLFAVASQMGIGVEQVRQRLRGHVSVLAGPSGVGKSTLANALMPEFGIKIGEVSEKAGRGKHTTRHVELFTLEPETYLVDTPGFSSLALEIPIASLRDYFPEFAAYARDCPYRGCLHLDEVVCAVKSAVDRRDVSASRYASYSTLLLELREKEAHRY